MQQAAQRTKKSKGKMTVWGSATAMSSIRTHAMGATPGGMHLDHVSVARGGGNHHRDHDGQRKQHFMPYLFDVK
jgi:hypothetical protein